MSIHAHSASTPTAPSVSVVIPVYNGARTLPLQLEALRTQVGAPPFEVIVVDNRSTDDLQGAMRPFMESGPSLRVVPPSPMTVSKPSGRASTICSA